MNRKNAWLMTILNSPFLRKILKKDLFFLEIRFSIRQQEMLSNLKNHCSGMPIFDKLLKKNLYWPEKILKGYKDGRKEKREKRDS